MRLNITILRVFSTITIVLYHCLCVYSNNWNSEKLISTYDFFANSIVNPILIVFTAISGYLFSLNENWTFKRLLWRKTQRLLFPYLFWSIIGWALCVFFSFNQFIYGHLWYLRMLLACFIVTQILKSHLIKIDIRIFFVALLVASCFFIRSDSYPIVTEFMMYYPSFLLGLVWLKNKNISKFETPKWIWIFVLLILAVNVLMIKYDFLYSKLHRVIIPLGMLLATSLLFAYLNKTIKSSNEIANNKIIHAIAKYSFGIYLIHHIFIGLLVSCTITKLFLYEHYIIGFWGLFIITGLISITLSSVISSNKYLKHII